MRAQRAGKLHPGAMIRPTAIWIARSDRNTRQRRISRLCEERTAHQSKLLDRECIQYARSPTVRRAILASLPQFHSWDIHRLEAYVKCANPLAKCAEEVLWRTDPKNTSGKRPICCKLPAPVHVGQIIAKDLSARILRPNPRLFDWTGRGRLRYANEFARAIEREGPLVGLTDIQRCYESIDPDALYRLNYLPTELIRWSLDYRNLSFRCVDECQSNGCHASDRNPTGPRGLLQGGPASSVLLTALIGDCVTEVRHAYCQSYADNFAVVGDALAVVQQAVGELHRIVAGYRVGQLEFHETQFFDARQGFDHLGFNFRLVNGRVVIAPNTGNLVKIMARIEERIAVVDNATLATGVPEFMREEVAAFGTISNVDLTEIVEAAEQIWYEEVERRSRATW